ncbi:hypothetical protein F971_01940 [Acinetobacter vivianii]|uniref:Uncharacterized protein n=1 Tax=Acinetobacter vivianii TaxID=1776742 RepID=N8W7T0_9GAMM|nr:hypothetical protein [Acinetobacter vivianii]ENU92953.1 hypothetical protein F971_01940 [Acinetobacter vivianii]
MINYLKIKPEVTKLVKRIPDPLLFPFSVFMDNGGYLVSPIKEGVIYKKGKHIGKIKFSLEISAESYEMNEHCIQRFKTFTELYLKTGPKFIEDLDRQGSNRIPPAVKKILFGAAA